MESNIQDLLKEIVDSQNFELTLNNKKAIFKQLSTIQLTRLVETIVDSPITQTIFNSTISEIMIENSLNSQQNNEFNIIDRTLFLLETRINTLGPNQMIVKNGVAAKVNYVEVKNRLTALLNERANFFNDETLNTDNIEIVYGIPLVKTELQLLKEDFFKNTTTVSNLDELRKMLGEMFISEIAKSIKSLKIKDTIINFSDTTFNKRIKIIQSLPAIITKQVVEYIENYKKQLEECYVLENNIMLTLDGTVFSLQ